MAATFFNQGVHTVKLPDPIKSALASFCFMFVTLFITPLLGYLQKVYEWASSSGHTPLPKISTLGFAAAAALVSAFGGLLTGLFRWAQTRFSWIPGQAPQFQGSKAA